MYQYNRKNSCFKLQYKHQTNRIIRNINRLYNNFLLKIYIIWSNFYSYILLLDVIYTTTVSPLYKTNLSYELNIK